MRTPPHSFCVMVEEKPGKLMMKSLFNIAHDIFHTHTHKTPEFITPMIQFSLFCARKWRKSNKIFKFPSSKKKMKTNFPLKENVFFFSISERLFLVYFNLWCLPDNNLIFTESNCFLILPSSQQKKKKTIWQSFKHSADSVLKITNLLVFSIRIFLK